MTPPVAFPAIEQDRLGFWDFAIPGTYNNDYMEIRNGGSATKEVVELCSGASLTIEVQVDQVVRSKTLAVELTLPDSRPESDKVFEASLKSARNAQESLLLGDSDMRHIWGFKSQATRRPQSFECREKEWAFTGTYTLILDGGDGSVCCFRNGTRMPVKIFVSNIIGVPEKKVMQIVLKNHGESSLSIHKVGLWRQALFEKERKAGQEGGASGTVSQGENAKKRGQREREDEIQPEGKKACIERHDGADHSAPTVTSARTSALNTPTAESNDQPAVGPGDSTASRWRDASWQHDVFISHAGEDKEFAFRLRGKFEEVGLTAFLDQADLLGGANADPVMLKAVEEAPVGLALLSAHFLQKEWPMKELKAILKQSTLLPVLVNIRYEEAKEALAKSPQAGGFDPEEWESFKEKVTRTTAEKNPSTGHDELPFVQRIVFSAVRLCVDMAPEVARWASNPAFALDFVMRLKTASENISTFSKIYREDAKLAKGWASRMTILRERLVRGENPGR